MPNCKCIDHVWAPTVRNSGHWSGLSRNVGLPRGTPTHANKQANQTPGNGHADCRTSGLSGNGLADN
eukprot:7465406-Lingulodinium_polyedra.AAC.1